MPNRDGKIKADQDTIPEESSRPILGLVFTMSGQYWCGEGDEANELREAAADPRLRTAPERKVSRERVGREVDLMLKSRDPVRALRLLVNLGLIETVFPVPRLEKERKEERGEQHHNDYGLAYHEGLALLGATHDHLCDCMADRPGWCESKRALEAGAVNGLGREETLPLMEDEEARRLLWYATFLKPMSRGDAAGALAGGRMTTTGRRRGKPRNVRPCTGCSWTS